MIVCNRFPSRLRNLSNRPSPRSEFLSLRNKMKNLLSTLISWNFAVWDIPGILQGDEYRNYQQTPTIWHWKRIAEDNETMETDKK